MNNAIDINTIKLLASILKPDPIAPVLPIPQTYSKGTEDTSANTIALNYIKDDIKEIKNSLKEITNNHVTITDFSDHCKEQSKVVDDYEKRLRTNTADIGEVKTQIKTWGLVATLFLAILQLALRFL